MKNLLLLATALLATSCSTTTNKSVEVPVNAEPDYVVRERNPSPAPDWMADFSKFKREHDGKGNTYFLGESGDVSERIAGCDMANLEAKKKIAQQIATLLSDKIASTKSGQLVIDKDDSNDPGLRKHFENTIAAKSMAFLSGVKDYGTYYEERDYSKGGGRKRVYSCANVVAIADRDLEAAIKRTAQKAPDVVEDAEAKGVVKEALKNIDSAFAAYMPKGQ